jgi:hypothetical protein
MNIEIAIPAFLCDWPFYAGFVLAAASSAFAFILFMTKSGPRF